jgi:DNA replication and repair protein RecF
VILRSLSTLNYRNLEPGKLDLRAGLTAIVGGNGQGKTNVLEAIFLCLTGVLDVSRVETTIKIGEREAHIGAELEREDGVTKLEVGLAPGKKLARVDGARVRSSELARHASAVLIRPEDADLVHGSPSTRRAFLDALVARMSPRYAQALQLYERTLSQRNAILRHHEQAGTSSLEVWDARLIELGSEIMKLRRRAISRLRDLASEAHTSLAANGKTLEINLTETAPLENFAQDLQHKRREELARGTTAIGPHRDDLEIKLAGLAAVDYASRGEARTIALALRKAEFDLFEEKFGEAPVLLIDDFTAELDGFRRGFLLELAARTPQAIITGTEAPDHATRLYTIEAGKLERVQS